MVFSSKYHLVWCPKYRRRVLVGPVRERLVQLIRTTAAELGADVLELEVMPDHVHLLLEVDPQLGVATVVRRLKGRSSRVLRLEFPQLRRLPALWTNSTFVSTVGGAPLAVVKRYIENQKDAA
jgi:putative transposase